MQVEISDYSTFVDKLDRNESIRNRLEAMSSLGVRSSILGRAIGVSQETLRQWSLGKSVRESNRWRFDRISDALRNFLYETKSKDSIEWLRSKPEPDRRRPLDYLVLAAGIDEDAAHVVARNFLDGKGDLAFKHLINVVEIPRDAASSQSETSILFEPSVAAGVEPSSGQLNEKLIAALAEIKAGQASTREVLEQVDKTYEETKETLPNYGSNLKSLESLKEALDKNEEMPAQDVVKRFFKNMVDVDRQLETEFEGIGKKLISEPKRILTYALSMRVIQALKGVDREVQIKSELFVAECRAKSVPADSGDPNREMLGFADAAATLDLLYGTPFKKSVVLDIVAASMLVQKKVDVLLLGAQVIHEKRVSRPYTQYEFVATVGTGPLMQLARASGIPVYVLAERSKIFDPTNLDRPFQSREKSVLVSIPQKFKSGIPSTPLANISYEICDLRAGEFHTNPDVQTESVVLNATASKN